MRFVELAIQCTGKSVGCNAEDVFGLLCFISMFFSQISFQLLPSLLHLYVH